MLAKERRIGFGRVFLSMVMLMAMNTFAEPADDLDKVIQFLIDPMNPEQAWMLLKDKLQFNAALKSDGAWRSKFDRQQFRRVTGLPAEDGYRHRKIQLSKTKPGAVYLLVDNGGTLFILRTSDYGETWKYSPASRGQAQAATPPLVTAEARPVTKPPVAEVLKPKRKLREDEAVDLGSLDAPAPKVEAARGHGHSSSQPIFKALFDLLLHLRPGISPWTFDNYHALLLVDIIPKKEIQFSFELSPTPRYYELALALTDSFQLRAGRIWIPFDDMNPHNKFGGYMNTSLLRPPGTVAFLPDLWTDLGVAVKYQLLDGKEFSAAAHAYVVNGFQSGGTDPLGEAPLYPSFASPPTLDNNTDKGMGVRLEGVYEKFLSAGLSFYTARFTPDAEESLRVNMYGLDSQLRVDPFELHVGYTYMQVGLPAISSSDEFARGGLYADTKLKLGDGWFVGVRGGTQNTDDRSIDVNDQTWLGGRVGYEANWFQISLQYMKDIQDVEEFATKVSRDYTAFRFLVML